MTTRISALYAALIIHFFPLAPAAAADHPWQITSRDGKHSLAVGLLAHYRTEWLVRRSAGLTSRDLYLRRFRLIASGNVGEKLSFFVDTDSPNLGKANPDGGKVEERIFFQDVILTYAFRPEAQLDAGLLLVPLSHNSGQGASSLMAVDYGPFSFLASEPTGSRSGRDYGVQLRGYMFGEHFEYRAGVFQGNRGVHSTNPLRYFGRVVWYPFAAETSFFYTGTTHGAKKILAVGSGIDHQMDYTAAAVDIFYDQPLRNGDAVTLQGAFNRYDGGRTFAQLPPERVLFLEAGYFNRKSRLGPFLQLSERRFRDISLDGQSTRIGGLAYWASGHRLNIKIGVARMRGGSTPDAWQVVLQGQLFVY